MTCLILTQVVIHQLYPAEKIGSPPFRKSTYPVVPSLCLGPKVAPSRASHALHRLIKGKSEKYSCLKPQGLPP